MIDRSTGRRPGHRVVVVGAGWAGLAAALAAREAHVDVLVLDGGVGASALGPGALDDVAWEEREAAAKASATSLVAPLEGPEGGVGAALAWLAELAKGAFVVPRGGDALPILATMGGRLRSTRARDAALLDLGALPEGARVLVPRVNRAGWDADALARLWSADEHALRRGMLFEAVDADVLRYDEERRIADVDFASRHDEGARLGWLGERLREVLARGGRADAIVLGPWLGASASRAEALAEAIGVRAGEALAPLAATGGMRFEAARKALLDTAGVRVAHQRATSIAIDGGRARIEARSGDALLADAVVLALGGLAGGGIVYAPPEHGASWEGADVVSAPLRTSVECGARVEMSGEAGPGSSMFGPALDETAWPVGNTPGALEVAGVREGQLASVWSGLFAAGEVIARRARTVGEAVASGRRAGRAAAAR